MAESEHDRDSESSEGQSSGENSVLHEVAESSDDVALASVIDYEEDSSDKESSS